VPWHNKRPYRSIQAHIHRHKKDIFNQIRSLSAIFHIVTQEKRRRRRKYTIIGEKLTFPNEMLSKYGWKLAIESDIMAKIEPMKIQWRTLMSVNNSFGTFFQRLWKGGKNQI
jgi:ferritin-like metal-binding protein YciE